MASDSKAPKEGKFYSGLALCCWEGGRWGEVEKGIGGTNGDDSTLSLPLGLLFTISSASSSYADVFHVTDFAFLLFSLPQISPRLQSKPLFGAQGRDSKLPLTSPPRSPTNSTQSLTLSRIPQSCSFPSISIKGNLSPPAPSHGNSHLRLYSS